LQLRQLKLDLNHDGKFQTFASRTYQCKKYPKDLRVDLLNSWTFAAEKATYLSSISVENILAMIRL